jgi:hypothetical protein
MKRGWELVKARIQIRKNNKEEKNLSEKIIIITYSFMYYIELNLKV